MTNQELARLRATVGMGDKIYIRGVAGLYEVKAVSQSGESLLARAPDNDIGAFWIGRDEVEGCLSWPGEMAPPAWSETRRSFAVEPKRPGEPMHYKARALDVMLQATNLQNDDRLMLAAARRAVAMPDKYNHSDLGGLLVDYLAGRTNAAQFVEKCAMYWPDGGGEVQ